MALRREGSPILPTFKVLRRGGLFIWYIINDIDWNV